MALIYSSSAPKNFLIDSVTKKLHGPVSSEQYESAKSGGSVSAASTAAPTSTIAPGLPGGEDPATAGSRIMAEQRAAASATVTPPSTAEPVDKWIVMKHYDSNQPDFVGLESQAQSMARVGYSDAVTYSSESAARSAAKGQPTQEDKTDIPETTDIPSLEDVVIPGDILDSDWYKTLTPEQQAMVRLAYAGTVSGNAAAKADADAALEEAKTNLDPYFKSQIALVQDELTRTQVKNEADYQSQAGTLQRRISALDDDLNFNRENLSIEEQADLARQKRQYEVQLEGLRTSAQESGLVFSSPRDLAKQRLKVSTDDTAQSTQRRYSTQLRNLEVQSQRERMAAEQHQIDLERAKGEASTSLARAAESQLGTKNLPGGTDKLGTDIVGNIEKERAAALLDLQNSIIDRGTTPLPL